MMNESAKATFIIPSFEPEPHNYMPEIDIITYKVKQQIKNLWWKICIPLPLL